MRDADELFAVLARSKFRSRFRLGAKDTSYLDEKTLAVVLEHGRRFVIERLPESTCRARFARSGMLVSTRSPRPCANGSSRSVTCSSSLPGTRRTTTGKRT